MIEIIVTTSDGRTETVTGNDGDILMHILRDCGFEEVEAVCGGSCSCGTCHVHIERPKIGSLSEVSEIEDLVLDGVIDRTKKSRLSCQIILSDKTPELRLTLPESDNFLL